MIGYEATGTQAAMLLLKYAPLQLGHSVLCIADTAVDLAALRAATQAIVGASGHVDGTTTALLAQHQHRYARSRGLCNPNGFPGFNVVICPAINIRGGRAAAVDQICIWKSCLATGGSLVMLMPRAFSEDWAVVERRYHNFARHAAIRLVEVNCFPVDNVFPPTKVDIRLSIKALQRKIPLLREVGPEWSLWARMEMRARKGTLGRIGLDNRRGQPTFTAASAVMEAHLGSSLVGSFRTD